MHRYQGNNRNHESQAIYITGIPVEVVMVYIGYRASIRRLMVTYGCKYISIQSKEVTISGEPYSWSVSLYSLELLYLLYLTSL